MQHKRTGPARSGAMGFLAGASEMAQLIRARDWSGHPFGTAETWPQSLRSALGICLQSAFPTAIYWGPELRLLYNDAWAPVPGPRHPAALGAPAREVWDDIWGVVGPQLARVMATGEGYFVENQLLPMRRFGAPEETYWSYGFTAIPGEDGAPAGVFNIGIETTQTVLTQRQMRILLELNETLRGSDEPQAARRVAAGLLGAHLGVDRVGFGELAPGGDTLKVVEEWQAAGVAPMPQAIAFASFGSAIGDELRAGRVLKIDDAARDPRLDEGDVRRAYQRARIGAVVAVPWMEDGRLAGVAYLHAAAPRDWNDFDATTIDALLERTRNWTDRLRTAERERIMMREIDHRARNTLAVAQSVVRLTRADDVDEFREKIEGRIAALARAHSLLASERWAAIDFAVLLGQELAPYASGETVRLRLDGPPVPLPPELAQTIALLLHELATNAAKHGVLGASGGTLDVNWRIGPEGGLALDWVERGPSIARPAGPPRVGFGSTLLRRVVEAQLGGAIDWRLERDGLICRIGFPLQAAQPAPGGAADAKPPRRSRT